jgi:hypothetical protein
MCSRDGRAWGNKATLPESSDSQVALCAANGRLYLVCQGTAPGSRLNVLESNDRAHWTNKITWATPAGAPQPQPSPTSWCWLCQITWT